MSEVIDKSTEAKMASVSLSSVSSSIKDLALEAMAQALESSVDFILEENQKDANFAIAGGKPKAFVDRLILDQKSVV